ncbi:A disintegrin and metalloproteinase with thrombospondin motifs 6 [Lingula anatina]|uniref:A disintegrin and metalloproteinase with thrombospondin motifs 6 n=1 Tax=Lingula anatina TaxID=7574 RepID=A0A1S3JGT4_LINAN|nr:A disintegrin and metalloproteinase with thrombospondin motifs 6 [Lingula anatina]|eukprot:XP_013409605.1 A disintegrin and metalloproteinase with thrombospondin motifs 6 [Lingula anatina]
MEIVYALLTWIISQALALPVNYSQISMKTEQLFRHLNHYEMVIPKLVDHKGNLISFDVTSKGIRTRKKRSALHTIPSNQSAFSSASTHSDECIYYKLTAYGSEFHFNLTLNRKLVSGDYTVEYWNRQGVERRDRHTEDCHFHGSVLNSIQSRVVLSNCNGLHGLFSTQDEHYYVEPLWNHTNSIETQGHPHIVYQQSALKHKPGHSSSSSHCGVKDHQDSHLHSHESHSNHIHNAITPLWAQGLQLKPHHYGYHNKDNWKSRRRRSVSRERHVETLVVVDKMMVGFHGQQEIEPYVLTIMNIVAKLYHDASVGNAINVIVTRLVLLSEDQPNLEINHHADKSLDSFCKWQKAINPKSHEQGIAHHDNAVLITRFDICTYKNQPCGTLGLAPVAGMCELDRSCSINEDIGLASAFTIAHEMGHNFGMQHDGAGNPCGTKGHEPAKIMAAQLTREVDPFSWSSCSRKYITGFLDSGRGACLENVPKERDFVFPTELPGQKVDADEQCKLQYGPKSRQCKVGEVCRELWCTNQNERCVTNSIPAVEGTACVTWRVKKGWCYQGRCVVQGSMPEAVSGGWGTWSEWGSCSRTCGGGVESSNRHCDNPSPTHGGKYCIGERTRYRSCNIHDCPINSTVFRAVQCTSFNDVPFRGEKYKWKPYTGGLSSLALWKMVKFATRSIGATKCQEMSFIIGHVNPCALNCLADGHNFYTERAPKVIDGTRCYPDSLNMCINGECRHVGCDHILGSGAIEDKCRVCGGDGTTCKTISSLFDKPLQKGSYQEVVTIPKGAVHINVTEDTLSRNYLALRSEVNDTYYINGAWTIDWPRKFEVAGTVFHYERAPDAPETLWALGPIQEPLVIMVLLQESNQGIHYEYNVPVKPSNVSEAEFVWEYSPWSECSVSCAKGVSKSKAVCLRKGDKTKVDNRFCPRYLKPNDKLKYCNEAPCKPGWVIGDWSDCSRTCGGGQKTRVVQCMQKVDQIEEKNLEDSWCTKRRPIAQMSCNEDKCPPVWVADEWSECTPKCGPGIRTRKVYCTSSDGRTRLNVTSCDRAQRPPFRMRCNLGRCPPPSWVTGEWGECSAECGKGQQRRTVVCKTYTGRSSDKCHFRDKPHDIQECETPCNVAPPTGEECKDVKKVAYCPLVLKFRFCDRAYFRQMCCKTCSQAGL